MPLSINPKTRSPLPNNIAGRDRARLQAARDAAISEAERAELAAREAALIKRQAVQLAQRYENMVAEYNGQLTIYDALKEESRDG